MARASLTLIDTLRKTAARLETSTDYQWGHMGSCNCGFLAQEITGLKKSEIHQRAMQRNGDWNEQLNEYCPASGWPMDDLISALLAFGFDRTDLKHLEKLSDPEVLKALPDETRYLLYNRKEDVVTYLRTWADKLEEDWVNTIDVRELFSPTTLPA